MLAGIGDLLPQEHQDGRAAGDLPRRGDGRHPRKIAAPTAKKSQQEGRDVFQRDGLADDEQNGDPGVDIAMLNFELMQATAEKIED